MVNGGRGIVIILVSTSGWSRRYGILRPMHARRLALVTMLALAAACVRAPGRNDAVGAGCPVDAKPANMSFTLANLNGDNIRMADYKGKIVFLNFWATWCVPCKVEIPILIELQDRYKAQGLEVIGVVTLDDFANVAPFAEKQKMNYTIVDGTTRQDIEEAYGPLPGLPSSFVIARDGAVCYTHVGVPRPEPNENLQDAIRRVFEAEIRSLL
jgi:thiol-disulfide isomerase/thioredoxin